ncbi:Rieske 2Fe-2S domain-containing protein, partial [Bosea sp. (in: a-proteobacteria)]|uniref:Rieske 2Fe-2S domain-containing protein n=1 Tax=Bosea sp. (in: a-proteobacteria) TaxID=1871050 RepID=UPI002FC6A5A0
MLTHEENEILTRVEGDAPMGQLMRRHWTPALLSEQLVESDGAPVRVRLFGEDLVAYRDTDGRIGVLGEFCPHRKASLFFGRNEECGLRCLYHGWKFDVDGNVLEMVSEPAESGFAEKVKHKAYPTQEAGGFIWVYMGPPELMPEFEAPAWAPTPQAKVSIVKIDLPVNWAQIMEGQIDSAHSSSLHSSDMKPARVTSAGANATHWTRPSTDKNPRIQVQLTNYGFRYAAIRRPITNAQTHDYIRLTVFVAPYAALIPPNSSYNVATVIVPKDDVSSYFHFIAWGNDDCIDQEAWRKFCVAQVGIDLDKNYRKMLR